MSTLRERLADPHGYDKPLFPKPVAEMSREEQEAELRECDRAIAVNVWQGTAQMAEVRLRSMSLIGGIVAHIQQNKEPAQ